MHRKPVILTFNLPIWRHVLNDKIPLANRMFRYNNLKESQLLKTSFRKAPNYGYFQEIFKTIQTIEQFTGITLDETTCTDIHVAYRGLFDINHHSESRNLPPTSSTTKTHPHHPSGTTTTPPAKTLPCHQQPLLSRRPKSSRSLPIQTPSYRTFTLFRRA